jgi:integrase
MRVGRSRATDSNDAVQSVDGDGHQTRSRDAAGAPIRSDDDEKTLLAVANQHLRAVLIAMLDTCCRPVEILSLQWADVDLEQRQLTIRAEKTKTRRERRLPISTRLLAALQMRRQDPMGNLLGPEAFVFGDELGRRAKSIRTAWENAREAAGLGTSIWPTSGTKRRRASRRPAYPRRTCRSSSVIGT